LQLNVSQILREQGLRKKHITLDEIGRRLHLPFKELNLTTSDVDGSVEAFERSTAKKLSTEEIAVELCNKKV